MKNILLIIFGLSVCFSANAQVENIELSKTRIIKNSEFAGDTLLIEGITSNTSRDIIISITGPSKSYEIWNRQKIMGMWLNNKHILIPSMFSFYRLFATNPIEQIASQDLLKVHNLDLNYKDYFSSDKSKDIFPFHWAFQEYQQTNNFFTNHITPITINPNGRFQIKVKLSENIPVGLYSVKIVEFEAGEVTQLMNKNFSVSLGALNSYIDNLTTSHPTIYTLCAVLMAVLFGGITGLIFNKPKPPSDTL